MKKLLIFLVLAYTLPVQAQNAFYDSKYIMDWLRDPDAIPDKSKDANNIVYNKLYTYIRNSSVSLSADSAGHYTMADSIYRTFFREHTEVLDVDRLLDKKRELTAGIPASDFKTKLLDLLYYRQANKAAIVQYEQAITLLTDSTWRERSLAAADSIQFPAGKRNSYEVLGISLPVYKSDDTAVIFWGKGRFARHPFMSDNTNDSIDNPTAVTDTNAVLAALRVQLQNSVDWLRDKKTALNSTILTWFLGQKNETQMKLWTILKPGASATRVMDDYVPSPISAETQKQTAIRIETQQMQPNVQLSNFKMPSQSEIIDALAIYIAKRFKQEAVIYMLDRLKSNMTADTLASILFPETKRLLLSQDAFSVPGFGTEWKYAISKDYALMPDHLLDSPYIASHFPERPFQYMHDAWKLAKMVEKKYSYVEIIRNFGQLQQDQDSLRSPAMKKFARWSYIINEEFFAAGKIQIFGLDTLKITTLTDEDYWLSPAQFGRDMSDARLSLLLTMLQERYQVDIQKDLGINLCAPLDSQSRRLAVIRNWLSRMLLVLNQFQKNQTNIFNLAVDDKEKALFNGVSYWTFMTDIVNTVLDPNVLRGLPDFDPRQLQYVADLNEIYGSFQNKNYAVAINQTLGILNHLCEDNSRYMVSGNISIRYKDNPVVAQKKADLKEKLETFRPYFNAATQQQDLAALRRQLKASIESGHEILLDSPKYRALKEAVAHYDWTGPKSLSALQDSISRLGKLALDTGIRQRIQQLADQSFPDSLARWYNTRLNSFRNSTCASLDHVRTYANLFTDIMGAAGNSAMLSRIIEAHAAPPTSYKLKKYRPHTWDIGAFLGVYTGAEAVFRKNSISNIQFVYGLTVPLGFNYTWSGRRRCSEGHPDHLYIDPHSNRIQEYTGVSYTLSLSLIDIAAPVAYRLGADTAGGALPHQVKWSQVLSPGIHFRYGIKNSPLCLSLGLQYTPQLRSFNTDAAPRDAIRAYVGMVFDMPLLFISRTNRL